MSGFRRATRSRNEVDDEWAVVVEDDHGVQRRPERARERERHLCGACVAWDRWDDPEVLTGGVSLAAGAILLVFTPDPLGAALGLVLVLLGAVRVVVRLGRARALHRRRRDLPPLLGIDPRVRRVQVVERITSDALLDENRRYTSRITGTSGRVKVDAHWGRAQAQRANELRRRHRRSIAVVPTWSAGYLVLSGRPRITPRTGKDVKVTSSNVLHLTANELDHPALRSFATQEDARWTINATYDLATDLEPERFSVRVVPTMVPQEGRRTLDLEIHWQSRSRRRYERGPSMRKLDLVRVQVPGRWGPLEQWTAGPCHRDARHPTPTVSTPDEVGLRTVEWRNVPVVRGSRGRHCLRLRFADPVELVGHRVLARVEARFAGSLSEIAGVGVHHSGGAPRAVPVGPASPRLRAMRASPYTVVELDAELCLTGLRYEDRLSLPPHSGTVDPQFALPHTYPTTVPGHVTIARLGDELSRAGYYVKRIAENPPRAGGKALTLNRSWNLGGRFYEGVYPIDFDLSLDGVESEEGGRASGSTTATLHVRGAYTTDEMKRRVLAEWATLWNHVDVALSGLRRDEVPGLSDAESSATVDVDRVLALLEDGLRHGDVSEAFAGKLTALLRPGSDEGEERS